MILVTLVWFWIFCLYLLKWIARRRFIMEVSKFSFLKFSFRKHQRTYYECPSWKVVFRFIISFLKSLHYIHSIQTYKFSPIIKVYLVSIFQQGIRDFLQFIPLESSWRYVDALQPFKWDNLRMHYQFRYFARCLESVCLNDNF